MKSIIPVIIFIALSGCAVTKDSNQNNKESVDSGNYTLNYKLLPQEAENNASLQKLHFIFLSVHGQLYGMPELPYVDHAMPLNAQKFTLSLPEEVETKTFNQSGLIISPEATKLLRVGTFMKTESKPGYVGGGAFTNLKTGNYLLLVHVNQKSRITGDYTIEGIEYSHSIHFSSGGWHWIELDQQNAIATNFKGAMEDIAFISIDI